MATVSPPHMYVLARGTATLSDEWERELLWTLSIDYKGEEEGRRYAEKTFREVEFTLISFTPSKMIGFLSDS